MNQKSRQNAKNSIKKDFFELLNNASLGYDCHNNLDNCWFLPIFDKMNEITYLKRYYNYFDKEVSKFVTSNLTRAEVEEKYNDSIMKLSKGDQFFREIIKRRSIFPGKVNIFKGRKTTRPRGSSCLWKKEQKNEKKTYHHGLYG